MIALLTIITILLAIIAIKLVPKLAWAGIVLIAGYILYWGVIVIIVFWRQIINIFIPIVGGGLIVYILYEVSKMIKTGEAPKD
jgi:hypothetical protein